MKLQGTLTALALGAMLLGGYGCGSTPHVPATVADREDLRLQAEATVHRFQGEGAYMSSLINDAYAYAVFPEVTKGGVGVGAAHGHGAVYEQGQFIGYADVSQGTVGAQLGGQEYAQVILFKNKAALEKFKRGNLEFAAQASAIAADKAAAENANYEHGVMVFTQGTGGLMFEAAIGGQQFRYTPA